MDLEERFRKLVDLRRMQKAKTGKAEMEKIIELRRNYKIYAPRVERVCRIFAKCVGWRYEGPDVKSEKQIKETYSRSIYFNITRQPLPKFKFRVTLDLERGIFLENITLMGGLVLMDLRYQSSYAVYTVLPKRNWQMV